MPYFDLLVADNKLRKAKAVFSLAGLNSLADELDEIIEALSNLVEECKEI